MRPSEPILIFHIVGTTRRLFRREVTWCVYHEGSRIKSKLKGKGKTFKTRHAVFLLQGSLIDLVVVSPPFPLPSSFSSPTHRCFSILVDFCSTLISSLCGRMLQSQSKVYTENRYAREKKPQEMGKQACKHSTKPRTRSPSSVFLAKFVP